jgi:hypothetical protein
MHGSVILLAAVIALLAWGVARVRAARRLALPGRSPASAIALPDYRAVDQAVVGLACERCPSKLKVSGEGSRLHEGVRLRGIRLECPRCRWKDERWFEVSPS